RGCLGVRASALRDRGRVGRRPSGRNRTTDGRVLVSGYDRDARGPGSPGRGPAAAGASGAESGTPRGRGKPPQPHLPSPRQRLVVARRPARRPRFRAPATAALALGPPIRWLPGGRIALVDPQPAGVRTTPPLPALHQLLRGRTLRHAGA